MWRGTSSQPSTSSSRISALRGPCPPPRPMVDWATACIHLPYSIRESGASGLHTEPPIIFSELYSGGPDFAWQEQLTSADHEICCYRPYTGLASIHRWDSKSGHRFAEKVGFEKGFEGSKRHHAGVLGSTSKHQWQHGENDEILNEPNDMRFCVPDPCFTARHLAVSDKMALINGLLQVALSHGTYLSFLVVGKVDTEIPRCCIPLETSFFDTLSKNQKYNLKEYNL